MPGERCQGALGFDLLLAHEANWLLRLFTTFWSGPHERVVIIMSSMVGIAVTTNGFTATSTLTITITITITLLLLLLPQICASYHYCSS